ncbi:hypothetical protein B9479_005139 [Cryptococcus floricola]|uniref:VHS domain-containing protein n=1 Tax=Cryptococcus floricola TaxID=2591691 RepID=A0A5D3AVL9_9TREE|nr:hypothetical protein B9479_005139 [Cryptococcus floricola]
MSSAGKLFRFAKETVTAFEEGKPHSSITDWIEVLSSDRYSDLSLDGIPELVDAVNIQKLQGTTEAARAIRKKLKYGNVHRQIRALIILRALTENASKGFQLNWANEQLMERLKLMATDQLTDPKVKKTLILVFHSWALHYKDEPRMTEVAGLWRKYSSQGNHPSVKKPTSGAAVSGARSTTDQDIFSHDWNPAPGSRGADTYTDLAAAKADASQRKREREAQLALEQREAEIERREREMKRKKDMEVVENRRRKEREEEEERRRAAKEAGKNKKAAPKKPPFNFEKEKPAIMVAVAEAIRAASNLLNACRLVNREHETVTESPRVQDCLDKAKVARRAIIRYIQVVNDEEYVGALLDANEKIVESIQLYDRLSKPAALDSDSEDEADNVASLNARLAAQRLEADRTGELDKLQDTQKRESAKRQAKTLQRQASYANTPPKASAPGAAYGDLQDLDFGSIAKTEGAGRLPRPLTPDSGDDQSYGGSLSDFSDYDSSDAEWQAAHGPSALAHKRASISHAAAAGKGKGKERVTDYAELDDEFGRSGLLDDKDEEANPFGDPFADEADTPVQEKQRMQWAEI